jgi:hypothetical protein
VDSACVKDFRELGVCTVGTAGYSAGSECVGRKASVVIGWGG